MQNNNNFCILNKNPSLPSMVSMPSMPYTSSRLSIQSTRPIIERYGCDWFCDNDNQLGSDLKQQDPSLGVHDNHCYDTEGNDRGRAKCG
jgi:hypothetical protein